MATKKSGWIAFPHDNGEFVYDGAALKKNWARLHKGDAEPSPANKAVEEAWRLYHAGDFQGAFDAGIAAGLDGYNAANKAACIYNNYLETSDAKKQKAYEEIAARCEELQAAQKKNANAFYLHAYALGRYGQLIGVAKALTQGIGGKVRNSLETAIKLEAKHADAHIALGTFNAEVIDKVGAMIGKMTYGVSKENSVAMFDKALKLNADSAIAKTEYANALFQLFGKAKVKEAEKLYAEAAAMTPADAMECLDIEAAKEEIDE
jgi:tetratricopeptide (TPR) repeat protein